MPDSNMKNIVVLKNLPSNLIDEAIVILKSNKNAKKLQFVEKKGKIAYVENIDAKDYIIKEAENVVASYVAKIEKNKMTKRSNNNIEMKYKNIKAYSIFISIVLIFCIIKAIF